MHGCMAYICTSISVGTIPKPKVLPCQSLNARHIYSVIRTAPPDASSTKQLIKLYTCTNVVTEIEHASIIALPWPCRASVSAALRLHSHTTTPGYHFMNPLFNIRLARSRLRGDVSCKMDASVIAVRRSKVYWGIHKSYIAPGIHKTQAKQRTKYTREMQYMQCERNQSIPKCKTTPPYPFPRI